jgi:two-component sensor histidine kinase
VRRDPGRPPRPGRGAHGAWLAGLALAWSVPVLVTSVQGWLATRAAGEPAAFTALLARGALFWSFWIAATPPVAWLVRRVPPLPGGWARALPAHAAAAVLLAVLAQLYYGALRRLEGLPVPPAYRTLASSVRAILLDEWLGIGMLLYAAVAGAVLAVDMTRRWRARDAEARVREAELEAQLARAQLDALRAQLHPHFLFNALNSVAMLVRAGARADAVRMLAGLGELLRRLLYDGAAHEVPLADELALVERYLEIEHVRFHDRLRVVLDVEPAARAALVPNLLLQPLVENALKHGIAPVGAGGRVTVGARVADGVLHVVVGDDGAGLPAGWTEPGAPGAQGASGGLGLAATRARLARLYGDAARLVIAPRPAGGTEATVVLPYRVAAPDDGGSDDGASDDGASDDGAAGAPLAAPARVPAEGR